MDIGDLAVKSAQIACPESGHQVLTQSCSFLGMTRGWSGCEHEVEPDTSSACAHPVCLWIACTAWKGPRRRHLSPQRAQIMSPAGEWCCCGNTGSLWDKFRPGIQLHWLQLVLSDQHHVDQSCWDWLTSNNTCHIKFVFILVNVRSFIQGPSY